MVLRNTKKLTLRPTTLTDAIDGTNAPPGSMAVLMNLTSSPYNRSQWVPRPAAVSATNFTGFTSPTQVTALLVIGNLVWGMISTGRNAGKDEPFCYNLSTASFVTINGVTAANSPSSPAMTGDWTPPCVASITNSRIMITHPGYDGVNTFVGWIDISSYTNASAAGTTVNTSKSVTYASNVITSYGYQVGYKIAGAGIPANTYITNISADGLTVTMSNAATAGAAVTTTVTGGTPSAPLYGAGNLAPYPLVGVASCVAQFNSRAYYAVANAVVFSDTLAPTQMTSGTQVLICGDSNAVNALAPLPLTSQVTGGSIQSLIAFKGDNEFFQITGDAASATSPLALNAVPASVGTVAPNTICGTPIGMAFISPDGLRILQFSGVVTEPIGDHGDGVNVPFLYAVNPTRMCMAYNQNKLRVTVENGAANGSPYQEYWYDLNLKAWSGPHTCPMSLIEAYQGGTNNGFVSVLQAVGASLFTSTVTPTAGSSYTENGAALTWTAQTTLAPDNGEMAMNAMVETLIGFAMPTLQSVLITALDEQGNILNAVTVAGTGAANTTWDSFNWGAASWGSAPTSYRQVQMPWTEPLEFKQMQLLMTGTSLQGFVLGNIYANYQELGYVLDNTYSG